MRLTIQQSRELLEKHGVYVSEACDRCGQLLDAVRFTRRGETGEWCSRECRGDGILPKTRKGGRPRKYRTEAARRQAERKQNADRQRAFRGRVRRNGKPLRSIVRPKDLPVEKTHLSTIPLTPTTLEACRAL